MRATWLAAAVLLGAAVVVLGYAASLGQLSFAWVVVVPVLVGTGPLALVGGGLLMAGLLAAFLAHAAHGLEGAPSPGPEAAAPEPARRTAAGGFVLVGPVPIAFGTTRGLALAMLLMALLAFALLLVVPKLLGAAP